MSAFDIVAVVALGIFLFPIVYAFIRLPLRLRQGDVEPAGRWSYVFRRNKPDRPAD